MNIWTEKRRRYVLLNHDGIREAVLTRDEDFIEREQSRSGEQHNRGYWVSVLILITVFAAGIAIGERMSEIDSHRLIQERAR